MFNDIKFMRSLPKINLFTNYKNNKYAFHLSCRHTSATQVDYTFPFSSITIISILMAVFPDLAGSPSILFHTRSRTEPLDKVAPVGFLSVTRPTVSSDSSGKRHCPIHRLSSSSTSELLWATGTGEPVYGAVSLPWRAADTVGEHTLAQLVEQ